MRRLQKSAGEELNRQDAKDAKKTRRIFLILSFPLGVLGVLAVQKLALSPLLSVLYSATEGWG